jgi:hypothetical protein
MYKKAIYRVVYIPISTCLSLGLLEGHWYDSALRASQLAWDMEFIDESPHQQDIILSRRDIQILSALRYHQSLADWNRDIARGNCVPLEQLRSSLSGDDDGHAIVKALKTVNLLMSQPSTDIDMPIATNQQQIRETYAGILQLACHCWPNQ